MSRREFITLLGGAAASSFLSPFAARAQQQMPVIGMLNPATAEGYAGVLRNFREGLKQAGYIEGENVAFEYRWAEYDVSRLPELAADLVRRRVALIAATGGPSSALAAKAATSTIPILFTVGGDPVRLGLVASLARPGGNLTGTNFFIFELGAKRLEALRELVPGMARLAVLVDPSNAEVTAGNLKEIEPAARTMGLQMRMLEARNAGEIDAAFASFAHERPDALFVSSGPLFTSRRVQLVLLATRHGHSDRLSRPRTRPSRRVDGLWCWPGRGVPSSRHLCGPYPQGRKPGGFARRAIDKVRAVHQPASG